METRPILAFLTTRDPTGSVTLLMLTESGGVSTFQITTPLRSVYEVLKPVVLLIKRAPLPALAGSFGQSGTRRRPSSQFPRP